MFSRKILKNKAINLIFLLLLIGGAVLIFQAVRLSQVDAFAVCYPSKFCYGIGNDCN